MSVHVEPLRNYGWIMRGHNVHSCHMTADTLEELHQMADKIGMKRSWFQSKKGSLPHYDLVRSRRILAIEHVAIEITLKQFAEMIRTQRSTQND